MTHDFLTFKRFPTKALADALTEKLESNGIPFLLEDNSPSFDPSFSGSSLQDQFAVKLRQSDFGLAEKIIEEENKKLVQEVDSSHYLYSFSEEELMDILLRPDEWSNLDYLIAQKLLKEKGKNIDPELLNALRRQRINDLSKPEESSPAWVLFGYLSAVLGGLIGIFIGLHLMTFKKTLPDGQRVYAFRTKDRNHGFYIVAAGTLGMIVWVIVNWALY